LVALDAVTCFVRVPGKPELVRVFTAVESDEARRYAVKHDGA
jgi:hypothetical protein